MDFTDLFPFAPEVGYLSLGLVNFLGSLIPFVPLPGFLLLATMSVGDKFDLHILALISAFSATAAKQIIFIASYEGRKIIKPSTRERMKPFERLVRRYGAAAAFFAAATPIPDDIVYVPLGLAKYDPKRFLVATLAGKLVLSYVIVFASHYLGLSLIEPYVTELENATPIYVGIIVFGASMTLIVILLLRLDWKKILGRLAPWTLEAGSYEKESDGHVQQSDDEGDADGPDEDKGGRDDVNGSYGNNDDVNGNITDESTPTNAGKTDSKGSDDGQSEDDAFSGQERR